MLVWISLLGHIYYFIVHRRTRIAIELLSTEMWTELGIKAVPFFFSKRFSKGLSCFLHKRKFFGQNQSFLMDNQLWLNLVCGPVNLINNYFI